MRGPHKKQLPRTRPGRVTRAEGMAGHVAAAACALRRSSCTDRDRPGPVPAGHGGGRAHGARTRRWLRARFWQARRSPAGGAGGTATPQEDMPQRGCARRHSVAVHMRTAVPRWWAALWAAMKTALVRWARAVALGAAGRARLGWYGAGAPRSHQASVDGWADDGATGVVGAVGAACAVSASALCSAAGAAAGAGAGSCTGAV